MGCISTSMTKSDFRFRLSASLPKSFHRSGRKKPFKSSTWHLKMPALHMLVLIRWHVRTMAVPLSQLIAINPDQSTAEAIGDRHYWVAQGHRF